MNKKIINSPLLNFFKMIFPSWKFFDESADTPVLLYRDLRSETWIILFPPPKTSWKQILFNPKGNLYLAMHSHIQQVLDDLNHLDPKELEHFQDHISYKITNNFVSTISSVKEYQFKISSIRLDQFNNNHFEVLEDILISPPY